jgi:small conductance mechanosensitive channel
MHIFKRFFASLVVSSTLIVLPSVLQAEDAAKAGAQVASDLQEASQGLIQKAKAAIGGDSEAFQGLSEDYLMPAAIVIILMIVGYMVASFLGRIIGGTIAKRVDKTLGVFAAKMVRNLAMFAILLGVLSYFGIDVTSFAAILAAAGFAVGMALQGTLGNFAAGIMLLIFRPFKIDDYVKLGECEGNVEEIGMFTTQINTLDNRRLIIPNGQIYGESMVHYTKNELRRVDVNVGAEYGADLKHTRRTLETAIENIVGAESSAPTQVYLCDLGDSSVNWQCRVWCKPAVYWDVRERVTESVKESLDKAGIGIPFPQMDVNVVGKVLAKAAA